MKSVLLFTVGVLLRNFSAVAQAAGEMPPFVKDSETKHELLMEIRNGQEATDANCAASNTNSSYSITN
jgi:hypothetical protein